MTQVTNLQDYANLHPATRPHAVRKPVYKSFKPDTEFEIDDFLKSQVFVVSAGAIGRRHMLGDGRETISSVYFENEVLDFRIMDTATGTLVCLLPVTVRVYDGDEFDRLKIEKPELGARQLANMINQHRYAARHCVDLARKSAVEKLASFIFECRSRLPAGRDGAICLTLKRSDIADYMGLRIETLSRAFSKLKRERLIDYSEVDEVAILNEPALRQIANGR